MTTESDIIERERQRIEKKEAIENQRKQMIANLSEELVFGDYAPISISPIFSSEDTYSVVKHWLELTRNRLNMEKMLCDEVGDFQKANILIAGIQMLEKELTGFRTNYLATEKRLKEETELLK